MKQLIFLLLFSINCVATAQNIRTTNSTFEKKIDRLLSETIPFKYVSELTDETLQSFVILDAREKEEYDISHIAGARYIGYDDPEYSAVSDVDKDKPLLVYCSIGYRSEKIGEKLKKQGFTNVYNLYGSIFEWVNQGKKIEDSNGDETKNIHTYNKKWSKWMINPVYQKTW
jgi:rhodanese-related sulfurtransferase